MKEIEKTKINTQRIKRLVQIFNACAHEIRLRILNLVMDDYRYGISQEMIQEILKIEGATFDYHFKVLLEAKLIEYNRKTLNISFPYHLTKPSSGERYFLTQLKLHFFSTDAEDGIFIQDSWKHFVDARTRIKNFREKWGELTWGMFEGDEFKEITEEELMEMVEE